MLLLLRCCLCEFQLLMVCVVIAFFFFFVWFLLFRFLLFSCFVSLVAVAVALATHTDTQTRSLNDHACRTCIQCMRKAVPTVCVAPSHPAPAPASVSARVGLLFALKFATALVCTLSRALYLSVCVIPLTVYVVCLLFSATLSLSPVDPLLSVFTWWSGLADFAAVVWHLMIKFEHFFL